MPVMLRKQLIEPADPIMSVRQQARLLGLPRSSLYYKQRGETPDVKAMREMIDEIYTKWPFYGSRRIAIVASERLGRDVNRKQVQRLMREMGIQAIGPSPTLSKPAKEHKVYPYLLRGKVVERPNEVWSTDITYIRLARGFSFLTAIIDWFSRYVVSWRLSNTLDSEAPIEALREALKTATPEIFNTDQGCQFTSEAFTSILLDSGVSISMDGRGRALDNVFVERLWRSVKYENVYPKGYSTMTEADAGLDEYFRFYNWERPHQSLGNQRPGAVHHAKNNSLSGFT